MSAGSPDHGVRRGRRPRPGQAPGDGRGRGAVVGHRDRHRRQSARRGCRRRSAPKIMAGAPGAMEIGGPPRSHCRGDPGGGAGRHHPARGQGPRDRARSSASANSASCRSTMRSSRGSARRERALDLRRNRSRDGRHARARRSKSPASPSTAARCEPGDLFIAMPGTVHDGHKFVERRLCGGCGWSDRRRSPSTVLTYWSKTPPERSKICGRASRERSKARIVGVTGSVGKTSTKEALFAALDRISGGQDAPLGEELQ